MTQITGKILLPFGESGTTPANGYATFTRSRHTRSAGALLLPGSIDTPIINGQITPVHLSPGIWYVSISAECQSPILTRVEVAGEAMSITHSADALGEYHLKITENTAITHLGDGTYLIEG